MKMVTPMVSEWVIPPGQEELLAEMLGRGTTLAGSCKLAGAEVDHNIISAAYSCPNGEVVFELQHPSKAAAGATQTARFAIVLKKGSPPDGLADKLASLIRSRESAFQWTHLETSRAPAPPNGSFRLLVVSLAILGIIVLGGALRRRRRSATTR